MPGRSLQLDAVFYAFAIELAQVSHQPQLIDGADSRSGNAQCNPLAGFRHEEALLLEIGQKTTLSLAVRVRDVVPYDGTLTRQRANLGHNSLYFCDPGQPESFPVLVKKYSQGDYLGISW